MPIFFSIEDHLTLSEAFTKGMIPSHVASLLLEKVEDLRESLVLSNAPLHALRVVDQIELIVDGAHGDRNRVRTSSDVAASYVPDVSRIFELSETQAIREVARVYQKVVCAESNDPEGTAFEAVKVALRRKKKAARREGG